MPKSKSRKPHRKHPVLTPEQKEQQKISRLTRESIDYTPEHSLALTVAEQSPVLRDCLRHPEDYHATCHKISKNGFSSIEDYGRQVSAVGMMDYATKQSVAMLLSCRTLEAWKRIAQSYIVDATLVDYALFRNNHITYDPGQLLMPFRSIYVDLGTIENSPDEHVGLFISQHLNEPQIDAVFVFGDMINYLSFFKPGQATLTPDKTQRVLSNTDYCKFVAISVMKLLSLRGREEGLMRFIEQDEFPHEHTEWQTQVEPIGKRKKSGYWSYREDGRVAWQRTG